MVSHKKGEGESHELIQSWSALLITPERLFNSNQGKKINVVSNVGISDLKSKHAHRRAAQPARGFAEMSLGITLSAVCSSSLRELISCFRYWISDSLTRSRTCGNRSSVIPRCSPAVPGDNQARAGSSIPHRLHASTAKLLFTHLPVQENFSWVSWDLAQACTAAVLPAHPLVYTIPHCFAQTGSQGTSREWREGKIRIPKAPGPILAHNAQCCPAMHGCTEE